MRPVVVVMGGCGSDPRPHRHSLAPGSCGASLHPRAYQKAVELLKVQLQHPIRLVS
jgi:hypothetical protein